MNAAIWDCAGAFPVFLGRTYADHVAEWRDMDAAEQKLHWMYAAIAVRLERATGGRPGSRHAQSETAIQKFIKDVGTNRQTFQRYNHTYSVFAETRTSSGTRYLHELSFKHFEVAARFFDETEDAERAIQEAWDKKWSANELQRQLAARVRDESGPKLFSLATAYRRLLSYIETWPLDARRKAPALLRQLADEMARRWELDDALPDDFHAEVADLGDPSGLHDVMEVLP